MWLLRTLGGQPCCQWSAETTSTAPPAGTPPGSATTSSVYCLGSCHLHSLGHLHSRQPGSRTGGEEGCQDPGPTTGGKPNGRHQCLPAVSRHCWRAHSNCDNRPTDLPFTGQLQLGRPAEADGSKQQFCTSTPPGAVRLRCHISPASLGGCLCHAPCGAPTTHTHD